MSDRDCTLACVKGGGKYVFVSSGKVYNVANQNLAALATHGGETVSVTGNVEGGSAVDTLRGPSRPFQGISGEHPCVFWR